MKPGVLASIAMVFGVHKVSITKSHAEGTVRERWM